MLTAVMTDLPSELARHYLEEAERVKGLASQAADPDIREALLIVVRQYENLAEDIGKPRKMTRRGSVLVAFRAPQ